MVMSTLKAVDRSVPVELVTATRGKVVRAEPISALYEQGRIHHCGRFDILEDQMCLFSIDYVRSASNGSPDRVDALVWGLTKIFDKITGRRLIDSSVTDKTKQLEDGYVADWSSETTANGWMV